MPASAWHGDSKAGQAEPRESGWASRGVPGRPLGGTCDPQGFGGRRGRPFLILRCSLRFPAQGIS